MTTTEAGDLPSETIEAGVKAAEARFWEDVPPEDVAAIFAAIAAMDPERLLVEETAYRAAAEIISLREQVAAMREALEPFAREAEDWPDKPDYEELSSAFDLRFVDLRRARAALKEGPME